MDKLISSRKADIEQAGADVIRLLGIYLFTNDETLFILDGLAESLRDVMKDVKDVAKDEAKRTVATEVVEIYRGWPGHFICADRCMFRLNTLLIFGEVRVVVSTVGDMIVDYKGKKEQEPIGLNRYYETAAFHAKYVDGYWGTDVSMQLPLHGKWSVDHIDRYSDNEAQIMHEQAVTEIAERMKSGNMR